MTTYNPFTITSASGGAFDHKFDAGNPADRGTSFPDFRVDGSTDRSKVWMKSVFLGDPGDTPELGLLIVDGSAGSPNHRTGPYAGSFIYSRAWDTSDQVIAQQPVGISSYIYEGRSAELMFPIITTPTQTNREGAFVISTCPLNHWTPFQRMWVSSLGNLVVAGRSTYEDASISYPYNPTSLGLGQKNSNAPGYANYVDTPGWANLSIVSSDKANNGAIAIRKGSSQTNGFDWKHDHTNNRLELYSVASGTATRQYSIDTNGVHVYGTPVNMTSPLPLVHFAGNDPKMVFEDTAGSPAKTWSFRSADGEFIMRNETDGMDMFKMTVGGGSVFGRLADIATNATDGFMYVPTCAGTPTGTPATVAGHKAMIWDRTNKKLYIHDGSWNAMN